MTYDIIKDLERINNEAPWEDADVERFIARLGKRGVRLSLTEGSETQDPKDAVDIDYDDPPDELLLEFLAHRRDLACWLRGLRGEARKAAVAEARSEARREIAPLAKWMAARGVDVRVGGIPIDQLPDDNDRGTPH